MSAGEKAKAKAEQVVGKTVRKAAHAAHKDVLAAKGAALEARGMMRARKRGPRTPSSADNAMTSSHRGRLALNR